MPSLIDIARTTLRIRKHRATLQPGPIPRLGRRIHLGNLRMRVACNPTAEYWGWLSLMGWRECVHRNDRRHYVDLPDEAFRRLGDYQGAARESVYRKLISRHQA